MFSVTRDYTFPKRLADNLRDKYKKAKRTVNDPVHVSDILPTSSCLRRQYYNRNDPDEIISNDSVFAFVRGEASEHIITKLANLGVAQCVIESDGVVARPDIMKKDDKSDPSSFLVVELKDNATLGKRLQPGDHTFTSYLQQLSYYLVLSDIENGILNIKYSVPELVWAKHDPLVGDYYLKPLNAKAPGIEAWAVRLTMDDPLRQELKQELQSRKHLFLAALEKGSVETLPRLSGFLKKLKCKHCPYFDKCWFQDNETEEAKRITEMEPSIIEKVIPSQQHQQHQQE